MTYLILQLVLICGVFRLVNEMTQDMEVDKPCPKCGCRLDYWDSRCRDIVCMNEGCDFSKKV